MDIPKRKANRLKGYDYSQNGAYFITICTEKRKNLLCDIVGDAAHSVPKPYGMITEKYIRNIPGLEKYVIMPNHVHMIVLVDDLADSAQSISTMVRSLKTLVTKEIGKPIFQRSFYDHVIRNDQDYREIWEYIENNPMKWKLDRFYSTEE